MVGTDYAATTDKCFQGKRSGKNFKIICRNRTLYRRPACAIDASSNHNGQFTDQKGIHGFWESRIPELLADKEWDFFIGKAEYIKNPADFIWKRVLESGAAADTVLKFEKELSKTFFTGTRNFLLRSQWHYYPPVFFGIFQSIQ